jgi:hypothetical protein
MNRNDRYRRRSINPMRNPVFIITLTVVLFGSFKLFMWLATDSVFMPPDFGVAPYYYPHELLDSQPQLPISESERSNDVIAKFQLDTVQRDQVLQWYRERGFHFHTTDSDENRPFLAGDTKVFGYGPYGISFVMPITNQQATLIVKHWKDM